MNVNNVIVVTEFQYWKNNQFEESMSFMNLKIKVVMGSSNWQTFFGRREVEEIQV